jgi:hypothetical protein
MCASSAHIYNYNEQKDEAVYKFEEIVVAIACSNYDKEEYLDVWFSLYNMGTDFFIQSMSGDVYSQYFRDYRPQ